MATTSSKTERIKNIRMAASGVAMLGGVGGIFYSIKTGGGFWRGVGYFLLGSIAAGAVAAVVTVPMINKIEKEA
jgi:multidrug efflux pump subunit AcrB